MISPESFPVLPPAWDYAGVTVFALTGALAAARDRQDIVTFWFFAVVTGIGGGTLRDLLIGAPVFWIGDATYLGIGLAAALIVWFLAPYLERRKTLIWLDALGLAVYAVIGAGKALSLGVDPLVSIAMGVLTACFGGVIRDVLAGQPSALLKREITIWRPFWPPAGSSRSPPPPAFPRSGPASSAPLRVSVCAREPYITAGRCPRSR